MKMNSFLTTLSVFTVLLLPKQVAQQVSATPNRGIPQCNTVPRYKDASYPSSCTGDGHCSDEFPADPKWLADATAFELRNHAWYLYSNIIQATSTAEPTPRWRTWYNVCDTFHGDACGSQVDMNGIPTILRFPVELESLIRPPLTGAVHFYAASRLGQIKQEILFNEDAWCKICSQRLGDSTVLKNLREAALAKQPPRFVGAFNGDQHAIVVKAFWLEITPTAYLIPYTEEYPSASLGSSECINWECWNSMLNADPDPNKPCARPSSSNPTISLKCFYWYPIEGTQSRRLLLGLHVITHEAQNWFWSTFWWHPPGTPGMQQSAHALPGGNPYGIQQPWTNYWADATLTFDTRTYNPYLEGAKKGGTHSNCLTCHNKAVYFGTGEGKTDDSVKPASRGYFKNGIQTDYLWSVLPTMR